MWARKQGHSEFSTCGGVGQEQLDKRRRTAHLGCSLASRVLSGLARHKQATTCPHKLRGNDQRVAMGSGGAVADAAIGY